MWYIDFLGMVHQGSTMENLIFMFLCCFAPPRTHNFCANSGTSREEAFEWSSLGGTRGKEEAAIELMYLACPGLMFVFISDK